MSPLAALLALPIRGYRRFISPLLGHNCRFLPTCSEYALDALRLHGAFKGSLLAAARILRCNPLFPGGYDPVPPKGRWVSPERKLSRRAFFGKNKKGQK